MMKMRERRVKVAAPVNQGMSRISQIEVRADLKKMRNGKAVGPDDIQVEV